MTSTPQEARAFYEVAKEALPVAERALELHTAAGRDQRLHPKERHRQMLLAFCDDAALIALRQWTSGKPGDIVSLAADPPGSRDREEGTHAVPSMRIRPDHVRHGSTPPMTADPTPLSGLGRAIS